LTTQGYLGWPFWNGAKAVVMSIDQKEPYRGMVTCQALCWRMVFLVWLRNEALNALKRWSSEYLSGGGMMKKINSIKQHIVYLSFIGSKQCYFGQNTSFQLNEMELL